MFNFLLLSSKKVPDIFEKKYFIRPLRLNQRLKLKKKGCTTPKNWA